LHVPHVPPSFEHRLQARQLVQALHGVAPTQVAAWRMASPTVVQAVTVDNTNTEMISSLFINVAP